MRLFKISTFVLTILFASCGDFSEKKSEETISSVAVNETAQEENNAPKETEVLSIISDLNVRSTPGKDGVVIDKLVYGQRAIFYGEETDYKEKIIMRGEPRFSSWKKIRFSGSKERGATDGWVYGGGVSEKELIYRKIDESHYTRDLAIVTSNEISELLGLEISEGGYSNGSIEYMMPENSTLLKKHGLFKFTGRMQKHLKSEADFGYDLSGEFVNGKIEGTVLKTSRGSGYDYTSVLSFTDGKCTRASISGQYLEREINHSTEHPAECTFTYLEKTLK